MKEACKLISLCLHVADLKIYPNHVFLWAPSEDGPQLYSALWWLQEENLVRMLLTEQQKYQNLLTWTLFMRILMGRLRMHLPHVETVAILLTKVFFFWLKYKQENGHELWFWSLGYKGWHRSWSTELKNTVWALEGAAPTEHTSHPLHSLEVKRRGSFNPSQHVKEKWDGL